MERRKFIKRVIQGASAIATGAIIINESVNKNSNIVTSSKIWEPKSIRRLESDYDITKANFEETIRNNIRDSFKNIPKDLIPVSLEPINWEPISKGIESKVEIKHLLYL